MTYDLKNKVVLVTGGGSGIGSFIVRFALEEGAKHAAILDITSNGEEFAKELNDKHGAGKAKFYKVDVTDEKLLKDTFDQVKQENGYLDFVVNNAGIMNDSPQSIRKEIEINILALVNGTLKAIELMRQDEGGKGGTVINVSSIAALLQTDVLPIYYATKSAVLQFSNCIGMDGYYKRTNVRVITVCFGRTETSLLTKAKLGFIDKVIGETMDSHLEALPSQSVESAAKGVIEAFKKGKSASTWLIQEGKPSKEITDYITRGYQTFGESMI